MVEDGKKIRKLRNKGKKTKKQIELQLNMVERLLETVKGVGIEVITDNLSASSYTGYPGGVCKVKGQLKVIINNGALPLDKAEILAEALLNSGVDLEKMYLSPDIRRFIVKVAKARGLKIGMSTSMEDCR